MAELKPFEVIMRLSPYAAQNKNEICFHAEKVTELVRCKNCTHYDGRYCITPSKAIPRHEDWFCANGEREVEE